MADFSVARHPLKEHKLEPRQQQIHGASFLPPIKKPAIATRREDNEEHLTSSTSGPGKAQEMPDWDKVRNRFSLVDWMEALDSTSIDGIHETFDHIIMPKNMPRMHSKKKDAQEKIPNTTRQKSANEEKSKPQNVYSQPDPQKEVQDSDDFFRALQPPDEGHLHSIDILEEDIVWAIDNITPNARERSGNLHEQ
ncbi:hypothetical protein Pcinc_037631 [Petrolisthes cinctipes]|uniref:Uncharacterized protein n=1 Tax=Petrolisthes cinctipes TaxID=88211 RepID=A0AAE1ENS6_PETCI|nr:hypothetical protein Pcinc_037631 [Petrolisthes cinctipes]